MPFIFVLHFPADPFILNVLFFVGAKRFLHELREDSFSCLSATLLQRQVVDSEKQLELHELSQVSSCEHADNKVCSCGPFLRRPGSNCFLYNK